MQGRIEAYKKRPERVLALLAGADHEASRESRRDMAVFKPTNSPSSIPGCVS